MTELILVGTDGSETATLAVAEAAELATKLSAKLIVVTAYPRLAASRLGQQAHNVPAPKHWRTDHRAEAEEILAAAIASLGRSGVTPETIAQEGEPAEALIKVAEERRADIIVVGNKGMTGAKRFLLGSVPSRVAHHAPCSVLIVRTT
ncbi:universal stress protein [Nocardioides insulae]|uniref:universal stress protein n=1 Tax=Nocardioides insulae TaxID=394734 RepID=UPI00041EA2C0|nr:universal stress protein [Nocardioides insulae]